MRVSKDEQIAGMPATSLRRAFRAMRSRAYQRLDDLRAVLGEGLDLPREQAKAVVEQLIAEGYIERSDLGYRLSEQGLRLAAASTGRPIPRAQAEQLLTELIERARDINQGDSWYRIARIELLGSMLDPSRETVNDIDLMVTLAPRYLTAGASDHLLLKERYRHFRTGKSGGSVMEILGFPSEEVYRQLKVGKRAYQLIDPTNHDQLRERTACTVVFEDQADPIPMPELLQ
jgi:predicted nucleotidyltransferase